MKGLRRLTAVADGWKQHGGAAVSRGERRDRGAVRAHAELVLCGEGLRDSIWRSNGKSAQAQPGHPNSQPGFEKETEIDVEGKKRKLPADRVHGYQVEIDLTSSGAAFSAIYDEARAPLPRRPEGQRAPARPSSGEWNKFRVECQDSIKT